MELGSEGDKLREDSRMAFASTSVPMVEGAPQNGCFQFLYPHCELQLPPASPGDSPRSAGRSNPGSFQIAAFSLGPGVCVVLCASFKSGISFPTALWDSQE